MINKKSIWFLTLFSLILVLSVYYVTMPSELLLNNNSNYTKEETEKKEDTTVKVEESEILVALRVEADETLNEELDKLKKTLTDSNATTDEKNEAYDKMKTLNNNRGQEETLEKLIKDTHNLDSFVKIDGDQIKVVIASEKHDVKLANEIMRTVQSNFQNKMYISVKFEK